MMIVQQETVTDSKLKQALNLVRHELASLLVQEPKQEQKLDKLWKILDHCITTNTFYQITSKFSNSDRGRCVNGVFMSYLGWDGNSLAGQTHYRLELAKKFNAQWGHDRSYSISYDDLMNNPQHYLIRDDGKVNLYALEKMNDLAKMSFAEIRDHLKALDV